MTNMKEFPIDPTARMNENAWLEEGIQSGWMAAALEETDTTIRKLRLFLCACYRRISPFLEDSYCEWLELMEKLVEEGTVSDEEREALGLEGESTQTVASLRSLIDEAIEPCGNIVADAFPEIVDEDGDSIIYLAQKEAECDLLRDIVGNPYRRFDFAEKKWITAEVLRFASVIYEHRAFEFMPELADTLQQAGCNESAILDHCHNGCSHVRGCWVIDGILGKDAPRGTT